MFYLEPNDLFLLTILSQALAFKREGESKVGLQTMAGYAGR